MGHKVSMVAQNETNTYIKSLGFDTMFVGCQDGSVEEFSMVENKTVHNFGRILHDPIRSMTVTLDNKSQLVCDINGGFIELHIPTRKQLNSLPVNKARVCVVTHNNKFLITAGSEKNCEFIQWSVPKNKRLQTWNSDVNEYVFSQSVSYDNKYQLIGYFSGWLGVFDLQKNQTLKNIKLMYSDIRSVAFSRDNQRAFISDQDGNIKMIKQQAGANSDDDFEPALTDSDIRMDDSPTESICLTKDEKYLLVGSGFTLSVLETETRKVTKEFKMTANIQQISLIQDGKQAIIAENNGDLSIIDLETLKIQKIAKSVTNGQNLKRIILI